MPDILAMLSPELTRRNWLASVAATAAAGTISPFAAAPSATPANPIAPKSVAAVFTADGVISIGEHGEYPWNELGQHL